ncbi:hypothetical protein ACWGJP_04885 [Microbacterium sp. NPDC055903]
MDEISTALASFSMLAAFLSILLSVGLRWLAPHMPAAKQVFAAAEFVLAIVGLVGAAVSVWIWSGQDFAVTGIAVVSSLQLATIGCVVMVLASIGIAAGREWWGRRKAAQRRATRP